MGAEKDRGCANVVYTTLAGLVEIGSPVGHVTRSRNAPAIKAGYHCAVANHANLARFGVRTRIIRVILAVRINAAVAGRWREAGRRTDMTAAFAALRCAGLAFALVAFSLAAGAHADDAPPPQPAATPSGQKAGGRGDAATPPAAAEQHRLPPDTTTKQTLALPGRTLDFTATAGSIRLFNDKGEPQADIAFTAYQLDGADGRNRPVTFVFNGGPGASSAWLQFGNVGPWRLPINAEAVTSSAAPELMPNAETWLDLTELVFIDPVGTGYSRFVATGEDVRKRFYSVDGDVSAIALVIRRWLEKYDRLLSPKFVTGESYGGIRGPKIVRNLQTQQGVGVRGLIMVSPLFDYRDFSGSSVLQYMYTLPSMAAVAREAKGAVTRADLADVERYAQGAFMADLIKGQADKEATTRLA